MSIRAATRRQILARSLDVSVLGGLPQHSVVILLQFQNVQPVMFGSIKLKPLDMPNVPCREKLDYEGSHIPVPCGQQWLRICEWDGHDCVCPGNGGDPSYECVFYECDPLDQQP